jgi:protein phosphatase
MSRFDLKLYCTNAQCDRPQNSVADRACANCATPLDHRYLRAVGDKAAAKPIGAVLGNGRYYVAAPQYWLDLQPGKLPATLPNLPEALLPYLHLAPQRLHVPSLYGFCREGGEDILLLDNAPIDDQAQIAPPIATAWPNATATRQLYWLWQLLQLWSPLHHWGVAASLLAPDQIRVQDWRIRLQELSISEVAVSLSDLAALWQQWLPEAKPAIAADLEALCTQMQQPGAEIGPISSQLNRLLLQQAALGPIGLETFGATDQGKEREHNEDMCFPIGKPTVQDDLSTRLTIVCDGIGGHEGGEVASHLAVRLLRPQLQALLAEISEQSEIVPPDLIAEQLTAIVRVVNNVIAHENDTQGREARRRMGTTLILGLQVPQRIKLPSGAVSSNAHELYLVNVGDSRAYWITPRACHPLTVDDDVATREVRMGRALYREALQRPDAGALTQALGTRDSDLLLPTVQRFILEEDGLLLLCSDGLSDQNLVEFAWPDHTEAVLRDQLSLEAAVQKWIDLANQKNGSDNISVVLSRCQVVAALPTLADLPRVQPPSDEIDESDLTGVSEAMDEDAEASLAADFTARKRRKLGCFSSLLLWLGLLGLGGAGLWSWSQLLPESFNHWRDQVKTQVQQLRR